MIFLLSCTCTLTDACGSASVLDNLTSFLKGELVLHFNFKNEFQRPSSMFSTIQGVLQKQDAREEASAHQSS
ncbi:hypothetical protein H5410_042973 [Solanum commersonii]|uniref:Uncharacterized protein n=1 Tax=Solanum commersonii TaxID=4109 RepID=A0A9J5XVV4_SOLCO|nr:hypothetical protein H5410_042973 [Solanum commersonii]